MNPGRHLQNGRIQVNPGGNGAETHIETPIAPRQNGIQKRRWRQ